MNKNLTLVLLLSILLIAPLLNSCGIFEDPPVEECTDYNYLQALGQVETDVSKDRVSLLFQVLDQDLKGVTGKTDISEYSLVDFEDEMTSNVEASVTISSFGTIPTEIYTCIVIDISKSVEGLVGDIKEAASTFVNGSLEGQKISIWTFDGESPRQRQDFTTNKIQLLSAINSIPETNLGTSTNLYAALGETAKRLPEQEYTTEKIVQSNLLVFTDGKETANPTNLGLEQAKFWYENTTVFVAALRSPDLDENTLKNEIASTPSNYLVANDISQLKAKFIEIQEEIESLSKSVYWLYYTSPRKGTQIWDIRLKFKENCKEYNSEDEYKTEITTSYNSVGF